MENLYFNGVSLGRRDLLYVVRSGESDGGINTFIFRIGDSEPCDILQLINLIKLLESCK